MRAVGISSAFIKWGFIAFESKCSVLSVEVFEVRREAPDQERIDVRLESQARVNQPLATIAARRCLLRDYAA